MRCTVNDALIDFSLNKSFFLIIIKKTAIKNEILEIMINHLEIRKKSISNRKSLIILLMYFFIKVILVIRKDQTSVDFY